MAGLPVWFELMTADPAAIAPFYRAAAGFSWAEDGSVLPNGSNYRPILRADGSHAGGLLAHDSGASESELPRQWVPYFETGDVDALAQKAADLGASVHMPPADFPAAGRLAMLGDPQGALFYLISPQPPEGADTTGPGAFDTDAVGHCCWVELNTDNAPQQLDFYTALLGWSVGDEMEMPGDHIYKMMDCGGTQVGAICSMKPEGARSAWLPYFRVADVAASKEAAESNGGTILMGPHDVPGGDTIIVAIDPQGAAVGLVSRTQGD